jgi:hypothetical protein
VSEPTLPDTTSDERDVGWGDDMANRDPDEADEDQRLLEDRPPHYDRD